MAVNPSRRTKTRPPLDAAALEQAALSYVGRYATSRARLKAYLERKLRERGWAGDQGPPIDTLIDRFASLGYVDDRAFAAGRAASLARRGYGVRRIDAALRAAGITEEDGVGAREAAQAGAWQAALRFAERRRIGPFARTEPTRETREKAMAALVRAGHPPDLSRRLANARPGEVPEADIP